MNWQYTAAVQATKEWTVTYFSANTTLPIVSLCFDETYTPNEAKKNTPPTSPQYNSWCSYLQPPPHPLRCNMQSFMFTLEPTAIRTVQLFLSKQPNENSDGAVLLALHVHSTLSICFAVSKSPDIFACFFCPGSTLYICLCSNDDKHYTLLFTH